MSVDKGTIRERARLLEELFKVRSGVPKARLAAGGEDCRPALVLSIRCLTTEGLVLPGPTEQIEVNTEGLKAKILRENDLLVSLRGTSFRVARVHRSHLQAAGDLPLIPDSNLGLLRLGSGRDRPSPLKPRALSNLMLSWLSSPQTEASLARKRAGTGAFLVRVADLRQLELPPSLTALGGEGAVRPHELTTAADLIEKAERSYRASLEIARIRRDLAHRVVRDLLDGGAG